MELHERQRDVIGKLEALAERVRLLEKRMNAVHNSGTSIIVLDKEHDRVLERIRLLKTQYSEHQTWSAKDRDELSKLAARRKELRRILGVQY